MADKELIAFKKAYMADREHLAKAGEELGKESIDDFLMWCDDNKVEIIAKEEEIKEIEFSPEEQEVLKSVTKGIITKDGNNYKLKMVVSDEADSDYVELEISPEDSLEEEMEEEIEDIAEEGVETPDAE